MSADPGKEPGGGSNRKRQQAPAIPDGWAIGAPDFIGVGAHKAGTTWWWALLVKHPEIDGVPRRKELHLLEHMRDGPISEEQREWYYRQFPKAPGHLAGEWTTRYMTMPPMPQIIEDIAPQAKLLAIVREPLERYRSGLTQWEDQTKRGARTRDEKAGKREALKRGFYGRQIQRLLDAVGPERLLVLQYERCVREPASEYARTLEFLGLSPFTPDERLLVLRHNPTAGSKTKLSAKDRATLVSEYEPEVRLLKQLVPDIDLSLWPPFAHLELG
ncbi:MAG: sulfotransferase [Chloroflexota bacterium]